MSENTRQPMDAERIAEEHPHPPGPEHFPKAMPAYIPSRDGEENLTRGESAMVDKLEDAHMADESPDGRPPTHEQRTNGWLRLAFLVPILLVIALSWAIFQGMRATDLLGWSIGLIPLAVVILLPVLGGGLNRAADHRVARDEALHDIDASVRRR